MEEEERLKKNEQRRKEREKKAELKRLAREIAKLSHGSEDKSDRSALRDQRMKELAKLKQERMEWRRQIKVSSDVLLHCILV